MPPSAHAERTFNHTPNAHGDVTQRQSAGFASRKLSVQIASSPPTPKCPSLRGWQWLKCLCLGHGAATSWQRGLRAGRCAGLKRAKTDHDVSCGSRRMPNLPNRSPTVHCARSCTLRQVPRSLPGRQGTTRKAKKWPPLRDAGVAFWNGANARRAVHGCVTQGQRHPVRFCIGSFEQKTPLTARDLPPPVYPAGAILSGYRGWRKRAAVAQRQRGCFVSSVFTVRIRAAAPPPLQDDPMLSGWLKVSGTAHNGCRSSVPCEKTSGQTAAGCLYTSTFSGGWHALR